MVDLLKLAVQAMGEVPDEAKGPRVTMGPLVLKRFAELVAAAKAHPEAAQAEPTEDQLNEVFTLDSGGPNPFYRCDVCGHTEPGLIEHLAAHWKTHFLGSK